MPFYARELQFQPVPLKLVLACMQVDRGSQLTCEACTLMPESKTPLFVSGIGSKAALSCCALRVGGVLGFRHPFSPQFALYSS